MAITLHASVIEGAKIRHADFELEHEGAETVKGLLDRADRRELMGKRFFKKLLARHKRISLTVMHNGRRLKLPGDLRNAVADGDEIDLLTPLVGG